MAFTNIGCISASPVFATQLWGAGQKVLGPVDLPDKFRGGMLLLDLTGITELLASIDTLVEVSMDGVNFVPVGGFGLDLPTSGYAINAGVLVDALGVPVRIAGFPMKFPQAALLTRKLRGTATLSVPAIVGMTLVIW